MSRAAPRVDGDVTWTGDVELDGDCIIGETGILRLAPGCRVSAMPGAAPPRLVVEGMLIALGQLGRPVTLDAAVTAAGGWIQLYRCRLRGGGRRGEGLHLFGRGISLDRVDVAGFETGLFVRDGVTAARRLTISGCPTAAVVGAGGLLRWDGGGVRASAGSPSPRILAHGELVALGALGRALTLDASIEAAGGRVELSRCRLNGRGGTGVSLYGAGHRFERVHLSGFETGLTLRDGEAAAQGLTIAGASSPVVVAPGGRFIWEGGGSSANGAGRALILAQGELIARGAPGRALRLDASIAAAGGRVELTDCVMNGRGGEGLSLYGAGHRLERVSLTGFETGLILREGDARARGLTIAGAGSPVIVGAGGRFIWEGGGASPAALGRALILVKGELFARGAGGRALMLNASLATDGGRVELTDCRLEGRGGEGVTLRGDGHVLERLTLAGFECALSVREGSSRARDLTITGARAGVEIGEGGSLSWEGGGISASGPAPARITVKGSLSARGAPERALRLAAALALEGGSVRLAAFRLIGEDGGELALDALTIAECGAGRVAARKGRLVWAAGGAPAGRAVITVKGEFVARGADLPFILDASLAADGGRVELANCRLEGRGGEGITLRGNGHLLEGVSLAGFECALSVRDGEARARTLEVVRSEAAVVVGIGGRFIWEGGGARDGGKGALVLGGQALLRGLRFRGLRYGVRVEDGAAEIDDLLCLELTGPGLGIHGAGFASLAGGRVSGGEALVVAAGHAHLAGPYQGSVRSSASARLCIAPEAVSFEALAALRDFVLASGGRPFWGRLYKSAGAASIRLFAAWARRQPDVVGAWVHRSWVAGGWEAGASDIDLALSVRELSSARARSWLARAQSLHAGARRLFPALGELLIAEDSEWRETAAGGLPRPGEWRAQARVLTGRLPEIPDAAPAGARLGARLEAAMAYSRLMDVCFRPRMAEELSRREAAKAVLDILRYRSAEGERGRALPREEFRAALSSASPEWSERLRALAAPGRAHRTACSLAAAAARHWGGREPETGPVPRAERVYEAADGAALRRAFETVEGARRDFDGAVAGAVFDTLHRSYLIVEPDLPEASLADGIASWARRAAVCGTRQPLPIVLTPGGWASWRGTAYHDFPSASAAWPWPGAVSLEAAGRDFPGQSRFFWGDYLSPAPSAEDAAAALAQAGAQFRVVRRLLAREARSSPAAAHHLLSRVAGLALAKRGLPAPDFDLDAALAGLESFAPRAAAGLRRAAAGDWSEFETAAAELLPPR